MSKSADELCDEMRAIHIAVQKQPKGARDWGAAIASILPYLDRDEALEGPYLDNERTVSDRAAGILGSLLHEEASDLEDWWPPVATVRRRIQPVLDAVGARELRRPGALDSFSYEISSIRVGHAIHRFVLFEWLESLLAQGALEEQVLLAEVRLWRWGDDRAPRGPFVRLFDHPDQQVRATAANEAARTLTELSHDGDWEEFNEVMVPLAESERRRPGLASPFIWGLDYRQREDPSLDLASWAFDLLVTRTGEEPEIPHFNTLEWVAADELMAGSAKWIQRLLDVGKEPLARQVALAAREHPPELKPYLEQFAYAEDEWTARAMATDLALFYRTAHPYAFRRGFVNVCNSHPDFQALVVYDSEKPNHPRIVVIYPRSPRRTFTDAEGKSAVDVALPPEIRGAEIKSRDGRNERTRQVDFEHECFVTYQLSTRAGSRSRSISIFGKGIQGPGWDPIELIETAARAS